MSSGGSRLFLCRIEICDIERFQPRNNSQVTFGEGNVCDPFLNEIEALITMDHILFLLGPLFRKIFHTGLYRRIQDFTREGVSTPLWQSSEPWSFECKGLSWGRESRVKLEN